MTLPRAHGWLVGGFSRRPSVPILQLRPKNTTRSNTIEIYRHCLELGVGYIAFLAVYQNVLTATSHSDHSKKGAAEEGAIYSDKDSGGRVERKYIADVPYHR